MRLVGSGLDGLCVIEAAPVADERGWFVRVFDADIVRAAGLSGAVHQASASFNAVRGTLRGMHWQAEPHGETKVVRCTRGRVFDVAVDLRPDSPTHCRWYGLELTPDAANGLVIPPGFAHGFVTLEDASEVAYLIDVPYVPGAGRGARFDDPAFGIDWPIEPIVMSDRDRNWPGYEEN